MSKEKQIEEMWDIITTDCDRECVGCEFENDEWCFTRFVINKLYNAGYRKQSEGEWILEHEFYGKMLCSNCKEEALVNECNEYVDSDFCPNCGAKMTKGENG